MAYSRAIIACEEIRSFEIQWRHILTNTGHYSQFNHVHFIFYLLHSEAGVRGKEITPYILSRVNELTKGLSLQSNIALVENNAKVGAQIASR